MASYTIEDWEERWRTSDTPWARGGSDTSLPEVYPVLREQFGIPPGARALVPLCGNSSACRYLYEQGHHVTAVDAVPLAIERLRVERFAELTFEISQSGGHTIFTAPRVELRCGDIFALPPELRFDVIYDCAAYVALSRSLLERYVPTLLNALAPGGYLILIGNEIPVDDWQGPPYPFVREEALSRFDALDLVHESSKFIDRTGNPTFDARGIAETRQHTLLLRRPGEVTS